MSTRKRRRLGPRSEALRAHPSLVVVRGGLPAARCSSTLGSSVARFGRTVRRAACPGKERLVVTPCQLVEGPGVPELLADGERLVGRDGPPWFPRQASRRSDSRQSDATALQLLQQPRAAQTAALKDALGDGRRAAPEQPQQNVIVADGFPSVAGGQALSPCQHDLGRRRVRQWSRRSRPSSLTSAVWRDAIDLSGELVPRDPARPHRLGACATAPAHGQEQVSRAERCVSQRPSGRRRSFMDGFHKRKLPRGL